MVEYRELETPMVGDVMLPNLIAIFKKIKKDEGLHIMRKDQFSGTKAFYAKLAKEKIPLYCWGIGREFFFIYEELGLKKCNIIGLIDDSPYKQGMTIDGMKICDPKSLELPIDKDSIMVTAPSYKTSIIKQAKELGIL
jgi:FlaA1/EpsC-like NDP-sugar epimerase